MIQGECYLHENGSLIYKPHGGVEANSPFVKRVWVAAYIGRTPQEFVDWLKEALNAGAKRSEVERCANSNDLSKYIADWEKQVFGGNDHA